MNIAGPFLDKRRKHAPKKWYLSYFAAGDDGRKRRFRPYYETQARAQEDKDRLDRQHGAPGVGAVGVLSREQLEDYERGRAVAPEASVAELAQFWRRHHPQGPVLRVADYREPFLADVEVRLGKTHQRRDLKTRTLALCRRFGQRIPATLTREEALDYLKALELSGRTVLNHKNGACNFFNYIIARGGATVNPFAGIRRRELPRVERKEIAFLGLEESERYLRGAERYDPELVAHEVVQLISGVRSDDEMANFRGEWVKPATREVVIPATAAKIAGRREVINQLEESFWAWWKAYGHDGVLRPRNYLKRWRRLRILAAQAAREEADALARLPVETLLKRKDLLAALQAWPWNARRRTFCTYHVALYQDAARTALILRQTGGTATLHNSYRGLGVTQAQGREYFARLPRKVRAPILAERLPPRGIVKLEVERRRAEAAVA